MSAMHLPACSPSLQAGTTEYHLFVTAPRHAARAVANQIFCATSNLPTYPAPLTIIFRIPHRPIHSTHNPHHGVRRTV